MTEFRFISVALETPKIHFYSCVTFSECLLCAPIIRLSADPGPCKDFHIPMLSLWNILPRLPSRLRPSVCSIQTQPGESFLCFPCKVFHYFPCYLWYTNRTLLQCRRYKLTSNSLPCPLGSNWEQIPGIKWGSESNQLLNDKTRLENIAWMEPQKGRKN